MAMDESGGPDRPSRVLVVDDNVQNLELLVEYCESIGLATTRAVDGLEALMSGFEVCQKLKSDPATRDIPIIMVTALNEMGDIERAVEAGTDDFLSKPVNRLELVTRVQTLLKLRHLRDELDRTLAYLHDLEAARPAE